MRQDTLQVMVEATLPELRRRARRYIQGRIRAGILPHPRELQCRQCGTKASEYDHIAGYLPYCWALVEPVCGPCHVARTRARAGAVVAMG